jgi:hypothetical protein
VKKILAALILGLIAGAALTHRFAPRVEVRTETEEVVRKDVHTIVKYVKRPDGSEETVTETTDRSKEKKQSTVEISPPSMWAASVSVASHLDRRDPVYNLTVSRRVLGPFFLGIGGNTDGAGNVTLTMEF